MLRHGQSTANAEGVFTGWADVPLTAKGEQEAARAGELLQMAGERPDTLHTSVLRRAIRTGDIVLEALGRDWLPVGRTWRLDERHHGALAGRRKSEVRAEAGDEQYRRWRRSLHEVPPPSTEAQMAELASDPRYAAQGPGALPAAESLADVQARDVPTGIPLRYEFDDDWEPVGGSGAYLDPEAAAVAAAAVARE